VWDKVKQAAMEISDTEDGSAPKGFPVLNRVFADETIRLLSLITAEGTDTPINLVSPSVALATTKYAQLYCFGFRISKKEYFRLAPGLPTWTSARQAQIASRNAQRQNNGSQRGYVEDQPDQDPTTLVSRSHFHSLTFQSLFVYLPSISFRPFFYFSHFSPLLAPSSHPLYR
jgi:hypothetical protein